MRVLVLGATGYLGGYLIRDFSSQGWETVGFSGKSESSSECQPFRSLADLEPVLAQSKFDWVVNTITHYEQQDSDIPKVIDANLITPLSILLKCAEYKIPLFLNCGTSLPADINTYSKSKSDFVNWGERLSKVGGPKFINLRLEAFYGPGDSNEKLTSSLVRKCLRNEPEIQISPGEQVRDFIYITDTVKAIRTIIEKIKLTELSSFSEISVGNGKGISLRELCRIVGKLTGSSTRFALGALPYRPHEVMSSVADISFLTQSDWTPEFDIENGLEEMVREEKKCVY